MQQPNKDYMIQSLTNQNANLSLQVAERDALMTELYQEREELNNELAKYRKEEIDEMDAE